MFPYHIGLLVGLECLGASQHLPSTAARNLDTLNTTIRTHRFISLNYNLIPKTPNNIQRCLLHSVKLFLVLPSLLLLSFSSAPVITMVAQPREPGEELSVYCSVKITDQTLE